MTLPSSTVQLQHMTMSMSVCDSSEHNDNVCPDSRQLEHHQNTLGQCTSVVDQVQKQQMEHLEIENMFLMDGALGDGVYPVERPNAAGMEPPVTPELNSAERAELSGSTGSEQLTDYSDPVFKKLAQLNGEINRMHKEQLRKKLAELHLNTGGVKDVLKKRLKNYYKRKKLAAANIDKGVELVPYDFLVVIDFEATCRENNDRFVHEIIEFPAVLIDVPQKKIIGKFREYCKPIVNPILTEFCKYLTGIKQSDVDKACRFPGVLEHFEKWLDMWGLGAGHTFCVVTDGPWDIQRFLNRQCEVSQLPLPWWGRRWINLRKTYSNFYDTGRLNLKCMLDTLGLVFQGRPHCGLDDSVNIARIVCHMLEDGSPLKANERLDQHPHHHGRTDRTPAGGDQNPGRGVDSTPAGVQSPSGECGESKPLTVCAGDICASSSGPPAPSRSKAAGKKRCAVREAESEEDEDVSDLLYYLQLQSS